MSQNSSRKFKFPYFQLVTDVDRLLPILLTTTIHWTTTNNFIRSPFPTQRLNQIGIYLILEKTNANQTGLSSQVPKPNHDELHHNTSYLHKNTSLIQPSSEFEQLIISPETFAQVILSWNPVSNIGKTCENPFQSLTTHLHRTIYIPTTFVNSIRISPHAVKRERKGLESMRK